jgi:hypothetical protein
MPPMIAALRGRIYMTEVIVKKLFMWQRLTAGGRRQAAGVKKPLRDGLVDRFLFAGRIWATA